MPRGPVTQALLPGTDGDALWEADTLRLEGRPIDAEVHGGRGRPALARRLVGVQPPKGSGFFLTTLPPRSGPRQGADLYRGRWEVQRSLRLDQSVNRLCHSPGYSVHWSPAIVLRHRRQCCSIVSQSAQLLVSLQAFPYPSGHIAHNAKAGRSAMAGRRADLMDLRELLRYVQTTSNLSAIQLATSIHRRTIRRYQQWAATHGVLDKSLPRVEELHALMATTWELPHPRKRCPWWNPTERS